MTRFVTGPPPDPAGRINRLDMIASAHATTGCRSLMHVRSRPSIQKRWLGQLQGHLPGTQNVRRDTLRDSPPAAHDGVPVALPRELHEGGEVEGDMTGDRWSESFEAHGQQCEDETCDEESGELGDLEMRCGEDQ